MPPKDELRSAIDSLRTLTPRLNAITDRANNTVREVERLLSDVLNVGVPAYTKIADTENGTTYLEFRRHGPKFRICVVQSGDNGQDLGVKAWSECGRDEKLTSFKFLPVLLAEIAKAVQERITEAEEAESLVRDTVETLGEYRAGDDDKIPF